MAFAKVTCPYTNDLFGVGDLFEASHLRPFSELLLGLSGRSSFLHMDWFLYRGYNPKMAIFGTIRESLPENVGDTK